MIQAFKGYKFVVFVILFMSLPAFAGELNLLYEQVIKDSYGNEIGYRTIKLNSPNQLPYGSPWRDFLNQKLPDGKTIYEYACYVAPFLSKPFNLILSDRNNISYSSKSYNSYNIKLYEYVTRLSNKDSKIFLFLHEFGHVAMLNAYPSTYDFIGLDYGSDNRHYIDEILPNANTAWVEGWANAFAANRNNGKVFSLDMNSSSIVAFLKYNSFEEMSRNELFVAKIVYDSFNKIPSGKAKAFDVISKTGPHYSLREFCRGFSKLYPNDKVNLARILVENSSGKATLNDILDYVNGGSQTVSRDLYNYLVSAGLVRSTAGQTTQMNSSYNTASSSLSNFWNRIFGWFADLFGFKFKTSVADAPEVSIDTAPIIVSTNHANDIPDSAATAPELPTTELNNSLSSIDDLAQAQEIYYLAFAEYNRLLSCKSANDQEVKAALTKLQQAKAKVKELKRRLRQHQ